MRILTAIIICITICGCGQPTQTQTSEHRVVSLAPSLTEIVCAIDASDTLVGRTSFCNYPPDITKNIPVVGGFGMPSIEAILTANPTLILEVDLQDENIGNKLDELGFKRKRIRCRNIDDVPKTILKIGQLIGKETNAKNLADKLTTDINEIRKAPASSTTPTVFVEVCNNPLMTAGANSYISGLIEIAGGKNIGDEVQDEYFRVSSEWVIAQNPDIILCVAAPAKENDLETVLQRPGWDEISAIKNKRVYDNFNLDTITRPGPRVIEGAKQLRECIAGNKPGN